METEFGLLLDAAWCGLNKFVHCLLFRLVYLYLCVIGRHGVVWDDS